MTRKIGGKRGGGAERSREIDTDEGKSNIETRGQWPMES